MSIIVLLMGVSSVGKSSVANALIEQSKIKFEIVGFDHAVLDLDKKYWPGGTHEKEGFYYKDIQTEHGVLPELCHGHIGKQFLEKMMADIIQLAKSGKNIIIDQVLSDDEHDLLMRELKDCTVLHVGLKPPLEEVVKREMMRGDRKIGLAESLYHNFYQGKTFDIEINTKDVVASKVAEIIIENLPSPSCTIKMKL
jgi:chloramphenicol 3-O phosphotransferase